MAKSIDKWREIDSKLKGLLLAKPELVGMLSPRVAEQLRDGEISACEAFWRIGDLVEIEALRDGLAD